MERSYSNAASEMGDDGMPSGEAQRNDSIVTVDAEEGAIGTDPITKVESDELIVRKPTKATTWLFETPEVIRRFVYQTYSREHHNALAERAKSLIEAKLKHLRDQNGDEVQAKLTCRAKKKDSLEEKLKMREIEKGTAYVDDDDIEKDVKDLAGVRIILYTPTQAQHDSVKRMVLDIWGPDVKEKKHDGSEPSTKFKAEQVDAQKKRGYVRKHFGYQAVHYRAPMKKEQEVEEVYEHKTNDWVEIQVVSALGHAWAEAGHDVQYKSYAFGPPTEREERILDALSGLVSTGDLLLEEFRGLVNKRTYAKWKIQEEFAIFFRQTDVLEKPRDEYAEDGEEDLEALEVGYRGDFSPDTANIVFRFLVSIEKDYPLAVRNALMVNLGYNHDPVKSLEDMKKRKENQELNIPTFKPHLEFPKGYLAPLCLIVTLLSKYDQENKTLKEHKGDTNGTSTPAVPEKCSIMMEALVLLQTFAGNSATAKNFLNEIKFEESEKESLNFVLQSPHRSKCFAVDLGKDNDWLEDSLRAAWQWFEKQLKEPASLCGLFFRLVKMGVVKETNEVKRLKELKIGSLSRSGTLAD
jgi:ppGpp synthetase/RelA/SpoT-type nucleotidyltranferase